MGKTLPVVWAEEAVRDAVRRVARALQTVDKDALLLGKLGVTTQDLWCLVDAGRATLGQADAVSDAVASAHLSGVDLPADWVDTLGKVASGEVTADDAVQAAVDGELRDRITRAIATAKCSDDSLVSEVGRLFMPPTKDDRADAVMAVVAPALRKAYLDGHDVGYAAANVPALADLVVRRQALANVLGVTDAGGASGYYRMIQDVADLRAELDAVKADRDKLNDEALRWTEIAGRHAEEIEQLRAERPDTEATEQAPSPTLEELSCGRECFKTGRASDEGCDGTCTACAPDPERAPREPGVGTRVRILRGAYQGLDAIVKEAPQQLYPDDPGPRVRVELPCHSESTTPLVTDVEVIEAPRDPRVWREGDPEPDDVYEVSDRRGERWSRRHDGLWVGLNKHGFARWDQLLQFTVGGLTEVIGDGTQ